MNMRGNRKGMTLVEVLAGLVILSILALVSLRYLGTGLTASGNTIGHVKDLENLCSVMERVTVASNRLAETDSTTALFSLKSAIGSEGSVQDNSFGAYTVIQNAYITFNAAGNETPDAVKLNTLKVKIQVGSRQLVSIFTN